MRTTENICLIALSMCNKNYVSKTGNLNNVLTKGVATKKLERLLKEYPPKDYVLIQFKYFIDNLEKIQVLILPDHRQVIFQLIVNTGR